MIKKPVLIQAHPYHLVEPSPWPLTVSFALLTLTIGMVMQFHGWLLSNYLLTVAFLSVLISMGFWFRDIIREGTFQGHHTIPVQKGLTIGFLLFIISEIFFFLSIFWAFFHSSLAPAVELGSEWPPKGIETLNPWEVPLLNTVILLSSGATVTWAHHSLIKGDRAGTISGLISTQLLAVIFTVLQGLEYKTAPFTISDSVFGSTFFFATGFHGLHVIIGTIFLLVAFIRIRAYHQTDNHHINFSSAIAYWHFVDVVWLFLFVSIYWWGS